MTKWWIGCSGFYYKHWKELFYPSGLAQNKWFDYYCKYFNTLELNVTFYQFPRLKNLEEWYNKSPEDFAFSVKAPRAITHFKKFVETERMISDFYAIIKEGLHNKLGVALFQLPPNYSYTEEKLDRILNNLNPEINNVLEFRHTSWWNINVYQKLSKHKISFSGMSHPLLPEDIIDNTKNLYYRFHGVPFLYASEYDKVLLQKFCDEIITSGNTSNAYIYFNNDIGGSAIRNALFMKEYCNSLTFRK